MAWKLVLREIARTPASMATGVKTHRAADEEIESRAIR
jgi:hypothetical protein